MSEIPINILYFSTFGTLKWGGQKSLFHLVTNLDRAEFRPYVVSPTDEDLAASLKMHDIDVTILNLPKVLGGKIHVCIQNFMSLLNIIDRLNIHLLHTDGPRNTFYAGLASKIKGIPLVWHVRDSNRDFYDRLLFSLSSKIILVSESNRKRFGWASNSDKFVRIYNGVDLTSFQTGENHEISARNKYGLNKNSFVIGVVARVEPLKGQYYLIEACGHLKKSFPDFHLLIVGDKVDPADLKECERKVGDLGIQDRVHFLDFQIDVDGILKSLDLFVLPSLLEAFPRSIIEAMAAGKPVIVTNVGGSPEAVEQSVSGFVVPPRDPEIMADRILSIGLDKELRARMGEAARIRAHRMFSLEINVRETEKVYREVLERFRRYSRHA
jgi:glycosyltransferase involved in cell wall biosynthesis